MGIYLPDTGTPIWPGAGITCSQGIPPEIFKDFIYLFLERGERRDKEREINIDVWDTSISYLMHTPNRGPGPQPRHVPWLGIKMAVHRQVLNPRSHTSQGPFPYLSTHTSLPIFTYLCISAPPTCLDACGFFKSLFVKLPCSLIFWWFWVLFVLRSSCNSFCGCSRRWNMFSYTSILTGSPSSFPSSQQLPSSPF